MPTGHSPRNAPGTSTSHGNELSALKRRRGNIKAACTRTETFVNNVQGLTPIVRAQLEERRLHLNTYWEEYSEIQSRIEAIDDEESSDRTGFEETYYSLCARIRHQLQSEEAELRARSSSPSIAVEGSVESLSHVRLPRLNLPTFSGKYEEWFPFHDTFTEVIHNNKSLGNAQKFQYLRAALTDEAKNIISALEVSDRHYELRGTSCGTVTIIKE